MEVNKWWSLLSEEIKEEIFGNYYGRNFVLNNWNPWWDFGINDKKKIQIYEDYTNLMEV